MTHHILKCFSFLKLPVEERYNRLREKKLCFHCLSRHDRFGSCGKNCIHCGGAHNGILCNKRTEHTKQTLEEKPPEESDISVSQTGICSQVSTQESSEVVMQVLRLNIKGQSGLVEANVLFDSGSDRTYVTSDLVKQIDAEFCRSESVSYGVFGSSQACKG